VPPIRQKLDIATSARLLVPWPTCRDAGKRTAGNFCTPRLFSRRTRQIVRALTRFG